MPPSETYRGRLTEGQKFERFVRERLNPHGITIWLDWDKQAQLLGENAQGVEIKLDARCLETQRLSIETHEKTNPRNALWVPSGILKQDNSWAYVQGCYQMIWVFSKKWLLRYYAEKSPEEHESHGTVRKFYMPLSVAHVGAIFTLDCTLPPGKDRA